MNTQNTSPEERPLGYWLTATDRLLAAEFARAFENEGITRRDWRLLNAVDGAVPTGRPIDDRKLGRLIELDWIAPAEDGWALTDDGRAAKERLGGVVDGIRAKVAEAVGPEEYATTIASLTAIARALGWDENSPLPRRHRGHDGRRRHGWHGHRFGPFGDRPFDDRPFDSGEVDGHGRGRRFGERFGRRAFAGRRADDGHDGRGHGFAPHPSDGHDPRHTDHGHGDDHRRHGHGGMHRRIARMAQHAYERGFDAGFDRGSAVR